MIYVDTSVFLAQILSEDRLPAENLWQETLFSSRLLEYEVWVRIHARALADSHSEITKELIGRLAFVELIPPVLARLLEPFPVEVRTLDAIHMASLEFLRNQRQAVSLATFDRRQRESAVALGIPLAEI